MTLDPAVGGEIRKTRPAIIVSNDAANSILNRVQVIPLTGNVRRIYPTDALVSVSGRASKALADQIRTVSKERLGSRLGIVTADEMRAVEQALRVQLGL